MSSAPRIVITGVGLHTGHGDTAATWAALCQGRSALHPEYPWSRGWDEADREPSATPFTFPAAPAPDPAPWEFLADRKSIKYMGLSTQMAVLAAGRALRDASLADASTARERQDSALFVATGPIAFDLEQALKSIGAEGATDLVALKQEGLRRCHPLLPFKMLLNMPLGLVSITFGIKGPNFILYPGADQGACALAHALRGLRQGRFSRALVGGSAHTLSLSPLLGLRRGQRLAATVEAAQPFSAGHLGWAPADQAAFLFLETESEAHRRGRAAYAVLDDARVLGPDSVDRLWSSLRLQSPPEGLFTTGLLSAGAVHTERARAQALWSPPATLACLDGLLGVAPAASFPLALAAACLALRQGYVPAALAGSGEDRPLRRALIAFHDEDRAAAAAVITLPAVSA